LSGGDPALQFVYLLVWLGLAVGALFAHKIPLGRGLKMFAAWAMIFLVLFLGFTLKDDFKALGKRIAAEVRGEGKVVQSGREIRIHKSEDGHFHVKAEVNGRSVEFMIDSGATVTGMSATTARNAGVEESGGFPVLVNTANGTISASRGTIGTLKVGPIERRDQSVFVSQSFGDLDVLGMNFLSSLSSWGVEGEWLVLKD
jgi:aspartyl protease family protein